ncbi:hypothetical protein KQI18_12835 [Clostridioides mangenotii]|uniref:hypothetical protein n=1 Tax=Metaclostridioides mangenotii TaxID=1540 RepID=UPI001C106083|nr:hypothetical protein [Clostridioides mangenotii]MBU5308664.1 hypothetical protein [Clostridioides mangenotii]
MYTIIGMEVVDSEEIKTSINENSVFEVETDMTKATKREDVLAYKLKVNIEELDKILNKEENLENNEQKSKDEEELFEIYMNTTEKLTLSLEKIMPKYTIMKYRSYKFDLSENCVKTVLAISHTDLGLIKLTDVLKRLLSQVD